MALVHKLKTAERIIQIRIKTGRIRGSKTHASMAHEKFEKTVDFMNSANGVLIVAGHDCFLHTSNIVHISMVYTPCNARRRLSFSCSNNKATIRLSNSKNKEWAQTSDKRCDYRLSNGFHLFHIDDEGKQSLRDEI